MLYEAQRNESKSEWGHQQVLEPLIGGRRSLLYNLLCNPLLLYIIVCGGLMHHADQTNKINVGC